MGYGRVGDLHIGPAGSDTDDTCPGVGTPIGEVAVVQGAPAVRTLEREIAPVSGSRGPLAGGKGDVLGLGPLGHKGAVDDHHPIGVELDLDPCLDGQRQAVRHGHVPGDDVRAEIGIPDPGLGSAHVRGLDPGCSEKEAGSGDENKQTLRNFSPHGRPPFVVRFINTVTHRSRRGTRPARREEGEYRCRI